MKRIVYFIFLIITCLSINAQSKNLQCHKWEGVSINGHFIYGITKTRLEAETLIEDFNIRNAKTTYKLSFYEIKKGSLNIAAYDAFISDYSKKYRVLTRFDIAAIHIFKITNFDKAAVYLQNNLKLSEKMAKQYLQQLLKEDKIYRLDVKEI